jgi:hypothetical protein
MTNQQGDKAIRFHIDPPFFRQDDLNQWLAQFAKDEDPAGEIPQPKPRATAKTDPWSSASRHSCAAPDSLAAPLSLSLAPTGNAKCATLPVWVRPLDDK